MRVFASVKVDQMPCLRPDDRAVPLNRGDVRRMAVMRDHQFPACWVIGAEEQTGQRVGVDMALKPHAGALLHVEYDAVAFVARGSDTLPAHFSAASSRKWPRYPWWSHGRRSLTWAALTRPRAMCGTCGPSRDKTGVCGKLRKSASAAVVLICALPGRREGASHIERCPTESSLSHSHLRS